MNRRRDVANCISCDGELLSPSFLYGDYVRRFSEIERIECSNKFLKIYSIVRNKNCSHFWHSICLYDFLINYWESRVTTRGKGGLLRCPQKHCQVPWYSFSDIVVLNPRDVFCLDGNLVKLSADLMEKINDERVIFKDCKIPINRDTVNNQAYSKGNL